MNFVRFSISYFCGMNGSIKQYEWFKRLNDRQVNELIGLIDDWLIIDTEPIDSNVWLDRERWTNVDFVTIFVSITWTASWNKVSEMTVCSAKTQISLGIRPVWSESLLCAQWVAKDPSFLHADSEDSDQTGRMPRVIWVSAGRTVIVLVLSWGGSILLMYEIIIFLASVP